MESSEGPPRKKQRAQQVEEALRRLNEEAARLKEKAARHEEDAARLLREDILNMAETAGCAEGMVGERLRKWMDEQDSSTLAEKYDELITAQGPVADVLMKTLAEHSEAAEKRAATERERAMLANAFEAEFKDPSDALGKLLQILDDLREHANKQKFVVAGTSLIQSSGVGKTRSLVELGSKGVYICYCSFQRKSGIPLRTPSMASALLEESSDKEGQCRAYLRAWLVCLERYVKGQLKLGARGLAHDVPSSSSPPSSSSSSCRDWMLDHVIRSGEQKSEIIGAVTLEWQKQYQCTSAQLNNALNNVYPHLPRKSGVGVLFVFDESSVLFSEKESHAAGINLRRALTHCQKSAFGVFVDTLAQISVLAPRQVEDPSYRVRSGELFVLDPVWQISTINTLAEDFSSFQTLESLTPDRIYKFGRPLWASWMHWAREQGIENVSIELVDFALRKLCGGIEVQDLFKIRTAVDLKEEVAMAVLGARLVLDVHPLSQLAVNLVASHLSFILEISGDRRSALTCEAWDPVVTEAAHSLFLESNFRHAALHCLEKCTENSRVDEGRNGELVARYILIRAMDEVRGKAQTVQLGSFLQTLLGGINIPTQGDMKHMDPTPAGQGDGNDGKDYEEWLGSRLAAGQVNFTGFHPAIGYTPSLSNLLEFFILRKAAICNSCQERFDFLIPVLLPSPEEEFSLRTEYMSFLGIQVKSIVGKASLNFNASMWMDPLVAGVVQSKLDKPFVTVLMQLGAEEENKAVVPKQGVTTRRGAGPNETQRPLIVHGLSRNVYPFLSMEEENSLRNMVHCRRHRSEALKDKEYAKSVMPAAFK